MSSARAAFSSLVLSGLLCSGCSGSSPAQSPPPPATGAAPSSAPSAAPSTPSLASSIPSLGAARPPEIVQAVYTFAADHPEVLGKVPCFCGCENRGHRNNDDCFVSARDAKGRVTAWEPHGAG